MKLTEIALGSKQHHELVAAARQKKTTITVGEFRKKLEDPPSSSLMGSR